MHMHAKQSGVSMDRLATLILTGIYGFILCWMFLGQYMGWSRGERSIISLVAPWIQWMVFLGGILLLGLFLIQLMTLRSGGHHHVHEECCDHDHAHDHHDHKPGEACNHDHSGGNECCDHGHDETWTPVRYIPLILPVIFFFMGQPSNEMIKKFEMAIASRSMSGGGAMAASLDENAQGIASYNILAIQPAFTANIAGVVFAAGEALDDKPIKDPYRTDLGTLEKIAQDPNLREEIRKQKRVEFEGEFQPISQDITKSPVVFQVIRLRVACCLSDARPASVPAILKSKLDESIIKTALEDQGRTSIWVKAQGKVDFVKDKEGKIQAVMRAVSVERTDPPAYRYIN